MWFLWHISTLAVDTDSLVQMQASTQMGVPLNPWQIACQVGFLLSVCIKIRAKGLMRGPFRAVLRCGMEKLQDLLLRCRCRGGRGSR